MHIEVLRGQQLPKGQELLQAAHLDEVQVRNSSPVTVSKAGWLTLQTDICCGSPVKLEVLAQWEWQDNQRAAAREIDDLFNSNFSCAFDTQDILEC